jgi:hypothetical protein
MRGRRLGLGLVLALLLASGWSASSVWSWSRRWCGWWSALLLAVGWAGGHSRKNSADAADSAVLLGLGIRAGLGRKSPTR